MLPNDKIKVNKYELFILANCYLTARELPRIEDIDRAQEVIQILSKNVLNLDAVYLEQNLFYTKHLIDLVAQLDKVQQSSLKDSKIKRFAIIERSIHELEALMTEIQDKMYALREQKDAATDFSYVPFTPYNLDNFVPFSEIGITKTQRKGMSRAIPTLEKKAFIEVKRGKKGKRVLGLRLTKSGLDAFNERARNHPKVSKNADHEAILKHIDVVSSSILNDDD